MKKAAVTADIVRIGNSLGVRIPKAVREQAGLTGKVTMVVSGGALVIRAKRTPREGWDEAFRSVQSNAPDDAIWPDHVRNRFDDAEWTW